MEEDIEDIQEIVFTKRLAKSGKSYIVCIPKDIVKFLDLQGENIVQLKIKALRKKKRESDD
jgi:antitoxin component of MazEF toxin-antitoxin module